MSIENRERPRVAVGGNVEIVSVSSGSPPAGRASILNCSRSGALFRLDAPRGGLFRTKTAPLSVQDSLDCVLRMPPHYQDIELLAEVVRVAQPLNDPKGFHVGVRFFLPEAPLRADPNVTALRRVLGKAGLSDEAASLPEEPGTLEARRASRRSARRSSSLGRLDSGRLSSEAESRPSRRTRRLPEIGSDPELTVSKRSRRATSSRTGQVSKRRRSTRSDVYSEPKSVSRRSRRAHALDNERSLDRDLRDLSDELEGTEFGSEAMDSASHVAEALKSDLFREESWSNYLLGASLGEEPKAPTAKASTPKAPTAPTRSARTKTPEKTPDQTGPKAPERAAGPKTPAQTGPKAPERAQTGQKAPERAAAEIVRPTLSPAPSAAPSSPPVPRAPASSARVQAAPAPAGPVIYTSLGGPENGLYVRGSAVLCEGEARVRLPEHFTNLIDEHTLTVQITPRGDCRGLYVARATGRGLLVRELAQGASDAPFDYLVLAERRR